MSTFVWQHTLSCQSCGCWSVVFVNNLFNVFFLKKNDKEEAERIDSGMQDNTHTFYLSNSVLMQHICALLIVFQPSLDVACTVDETVEGEGTNQGTETSLSEKAQSKELTHYCISSYSTHHNNVKKGKLDEIT